MYMLYTVTCQILFKTGISMLTGLKVSSLSYQRIFYRQEILKV